MVDRMASQGYCWEGKGGWGSVSRERGERDRGKEGRASQDESEEVGRDEYREGRTCPREGKERKHSWGDRKN